MNVSKFEKYLGAENLTVAEAMNRIDKNSKGILILVNHNGRLAGTLTDGDVRRYLLTGGRMDDSSIKAANTKPRFAVSKQDAEQLYHHENYIAIPIVDENYLVIDVYDGEKEDDWYPKLNVPVVINAGGMGKRLEPFTKILPKPLIPVGELPIIEHIMSYFTLYGCNQFHIIVNYKKQLLKAYFAESEKRYNIIWYDEERPLGTGGGLTLLRGKIGSTFFFTSCDTLIDINYGNLLNYHKEKSCAVTMVCAQKKVLVPYGIVNMGKNGRIEAFEEKPSFSFLTNTGFYLVEPVVFNYMEDDHPIGFPDVVEKMGAAGENTFCYPISEKDWMDMGQLSELEKMRERIYGA